MVLPDELAAVFGDNSAMTHPVALRSRLGSVLGESHLVLSQGGLRVFGKTSLFAPLVELAGVSSACVERSSLRQELILEHQDGTTTIALGFGEEEQVVSLLEALERVAPANTGAPLDEPVASSADGRESPSDACLRDLRASLLVRLASDAPLRRERSTLLNVFAQRQRSLSLPAPPHRLGEWLARAPGPSERRVLQAARDALT
jgi:hypothetical protein